jgi:hypothetical protein
VTGFDGSATALARARERARARGVDVELVQADATRLEGVEQRFTTVVDSALYHCLGDEERTAYAAALHRVTLPGAELHLFCFADIESEGFRIPVMQVSQQDLRTHLAGRWDIRSIELTHYTTSFTLELFDEQRISAFQAMGAERSTATRCAPIRGDGSPCPSGTSTPCGRSRPTGCRSTGAEPHVDQHTQVARAQRVTGAEPGGVPSLLAASGESWGVGGSAGGAGNTWMVWDASGSFFVWPKDMARAQTQPMNVQPRKALMTTTGPMERSLRATAMMVGRK